MLLAKITRILGFRIFSPALHHHIAYRAHPVHPQTPPHAIRSSRFFSMQAQSVPQAKHQNVMLPLYWGLPAIFAFLFLLYTDNIKKRVQAPSILQSGVSREGLAVIDANSLRVTTETYGGHSHVHKAFYKENCYFYKETFNRQKLVNELLFAALGKLLFAADYPDILVVEKFEEALSRYGMLSESLDKDNNMDLQKWAELFCEGKSILKPRTHLGLALAFDMLMGKTDVKLANLIFLKKTGKCYSIDHESAGGANPSFITRAKDALQYIGEFKQQTAIQQAHQATAFDESMEIGTESIYIPLQGNEAAKAHIQPALLAAIEQDIDSGAIQAFYQRFASLSLADMMNIGDRYGGFISADEKAAFVADLKQRQDELKAFLSQPSMTRSFSSA